MSHRHGEVETELSKFKRGGVSSHVSVLSRKTPAAERNSYHFMDVLHHLRAAASNLML